MTSSLGSEPGSGGGGDWQDTNGDEPSKPKRMRLNEGDQYFVCDFDILGATDCVLSSINVEDVLQDQICKYSRLNLANLETLCLLSLQLHINNGNVAEVLAAADMLVMDEARDLCLDHLLNNMDVDNCLSLASLAQWHHWPGFRDTVFAFVREHFDAVWRSSSEFSKASATLLVELFSSSELNVRDEVDLLRAVRRWYTRGRARTKQRIAGLLALLQCARIGLCRESAYHGVALVGKFLYVVGGMRGSSYLRSCDRFDTERCAWDPCSAMHMARGYVAVAALDNYVYAVGGRDGKLYASGGFDGHLILSSVEEYTPSSNSWCLVRQMPSPRCSHQMVEMAGRIYIVGGYNGRCRLSTSEDNQRVHRRGIHSWETTSAVRVPKKSP
ncbi:hypothetical protein V5799_028437 [Amblyomma americanum]|uniref:BACK domain-containing protein n=1 Tax=Amblyomma americanum TaxID=6943 RepID=A0AAQ4DCV6_AMBAM